MAYAALADIERELDLLDTDVDETTLQDKLDQAEDIIENVTRRVFEADEDETRTINCDDEHVNGRSLYLPWDLCQISSITNGDGTAVDLSYLTTRPFLKSLSGGVLSVPANHPDGWPWYELRLKASSDVTWTYDTDREDAISITGRWAFSVTAPPLIKAATIRLAAWLYTQKDDLRDRPETETTPDGLLLLMSDLPEDVQMRLRKFVKVV